MRKIVLPDGEPLTFGILKELNPGVPTEELASSFERLPQEIQAQAWEHLKLRVALENWADEPDWGAG